MSDAPQRTEPERLEESAAATQGSESTHKTGLSMHEDVPVWYDCCSCEAEPYWVEQLGEPPGGDPSAESDA